MTRRYFLKAIAAALSTAAIPSSLEKLQEPEFVVKHYFLDGPTTFARSDAYMLSFDYNENGELQLLPQQAQV